MHYLTEQAADRPKRYLWSAGIFSLIMIALVAVPSLFPSSVPFLNPLKIDTDPENMLAAEEPVRIFHNQMKKEFSLHDMIVVGVIDTVHADGVFTPETLTEVYELARFAQELHWQEAGETAGVIGVDVISPSTVDNIEQGGLGSVSFDWLMSKPPSNRAEALAVAEKARRIPMLNETLVSEDGKALALYLPISAKDQSYRVANSLREKISEFKSGADYHITGLTIAQDQFGVEMFVQMAIAAPMAMLLIFGLMWFFFRQVNLIVSPMIVAMVSVIGSMGLLVASGNTVHIMSSMIPIFVMPIAVLDAVHILSDFFDSYPKFNDRRKTLRHIMGELWRPMLFTTLTTCAGFGSLAFTPIPPVQVFGIFVAIGVFMAWFFTVTLVPAYIMVMPESSFAKFGLGVARDSENPDEKPANVSKFLLATGNFAFQRAKIVVLGLVVLVVGAVYGINQIVVNDNPVKWFSPDHEIRVADRALNERFAGTYMAYLSLTTDAPLFILTSYSTDLLSRLGSKMNFSENGIIGDGVSDGVVASASDRTGSDGTGTLLSTMQQKISSQKPTDKPALVTLLKNVVLEQQDQVETDEEWEGLEEILIFLDKELQADQVFKRPEILEYIVKLQTHLKETGLVGKSNALPDIVKTVHRDLFLGEDAAFRIPDSGAAVAQTLITYQNSHRPQDLWRFVTPDYQRANLWIQLRSGDNTDMNALVAEVDKFMSENPAPGSLQNNLLQHEWFGLTYINVIWQDKMVKGMATAFLGSFVIVLGLMVLLFRSFLWGLLSMVPLTLTIGTIYGVIGLIGKDYDMPVAVLSSLSLGLAVDYAIHFCARTRQIYDRTGNWKETLDEAFGEPARAIFRNVIVIGCGFLPLLAAPLIPYQTVGIFISAILFLAGLASLVVLPAFITLGEKFLFKESDRSVS